MSKADEMFEKLKYKNIKDEDEEIFYKDKYRGNKIYFDYEFHSVCIEDYFDEEAGIIYMQELKAIYKKCKELGWLDE